MVLWGKSTGLLQVYRVRAVLQEPGTRKLYKVLYPQLKRLGIGRGRLFDTVRANHLGIRPKRQYHVTTESHHSIRNHKKL